MPSKIRKEILNSRLEKAETECKIKLIGEYLGMKHPASWKCLICFHEWKTESHHIIGTSNLTGCPLCAPNRPVTNSVVDSILISQNRPIKRIGYVKNSTSKIDWQCLNCNFIWSNSPTNIIKKNSKCPPCHKSLGENTVRTILESNNIEFNWQYPIYLDNKINKNERAKIIDFYLPKYNLFIEYNGSQHYEDRHFKNDFNLEMQKLRDENIRKFCISNNINLFEIDSRIYRKIIYKDNSYIEFKNTLEFDILKYLSEIK